MTKYRYLPARTNKISDSGVFELAKYESNGSRRI